MNADDTPNTIDLAPFDQAIGEWSKNHKLMIKNRWVPFILAASITKDYLDVGAGVAERMLREACASGDVRAQQLICDQKFGWVPELIKPREWLEDQMDLKWQTREDVTRVLYLGLEHASKDTEDIVDWIELNVLDLPDDIRKPYEAMCHARRQVWETRKSVMHVFGVYVNKNDCKRWLHKLKPKAEPATAGGKQSRIIRLLKEMFPKGVPSRDDCPRQPLTAELVKRDPSLKPLDPKTLKTAIDAYNRQLGSAGKH